MKNILETNYLKEFTATADNMYRLGWDERNGGNISCIVSEEEIKETAGIDKVVRTIPLGFDAIKLAGKHFLVTGTGKYFKNVKSDPERSVGLFRVSDDGKNAELLWGYSDGGRFTSELPAHLMSHISRLSVDPENRVIMHCHPTSLLAMTYVHELDTNSFTHTLWQMSTECVVVFPDGVEVLPWMLCGTNEIGRATAEKMLTSRCVIWALHGIYGAGKDLDEAFGLVETVEKAATVFMLTSHMERINTITDDQLRILAKAFKVTPRPGIL